MIVGVGIDLIGDSDFQKRIDRSPSLLVSLLRISHDFNVNKVQANLREGVSNSEMDIQRAKSNLVCIEAILKALPVQLRSELHKFQISRDELGKPSIVYFGQIEELLNQFKFHLSISHDSGVTIGIVIIESV